MRNYLILLILVILANISYTQSTAFVINLGPSIGSQRWDNSQRQTLFAYHASLAVESVNTEDDKNSLLAQVGYHVKGSANRFNFIDPRGGFNITSQPFKFNNLSLLVGAKQKFAFGPSGRFRYFYFGGIRGDYTLNTNLDELNQSNDLLANTGIYPDEGGVRHFIFGVTAGGGLQFELSDLIGAQISVSLNPDLTNQYYSGPIPNVIDPFTPGQTFTIPERRIRNTTLEISIGLRLLRKVEYVE